MRTLYEQLKEIINQNIEVIPIGKREKTIVNRMGILTQVLQAVKQRDKYVLGKNIKVPPHGYSLSLPDVVRTINEAINYERDEQRKRAKESL